MTIVDALIFGLLLCGSAFFSGTETALTSVQESKLSTLAEKGNRAAQRVMALIANRGTVIGAMLIGNNIVNTLLAIYAATVFNAVILNSPLPPWMAPVAASVLSIVVLLIGGEVVPKNIGLRFNTRWALLAAYPCTYFIKLVTPVLWGLNLINRLMLSILGGQDTRSGPSVDELLALVKMSQKAGIIDPMERELIGKSMFLNETLAKEIMIHRTQVCAVAETSTLADVQAVFVRELFSRLPVYRENLDQIVGILNIKEVFRFDAKNTGFRIADVMTPPLVYPETAKIGAIFDKMRQSRSHMVIVVDEFGSTSGIITLEDIVEQIFGEISDEYDAQSPARFRWVGAQVFEAEGRTSLSEVQEELEKKHCRVLPADACEDVETLAGLVMKVLGNIPSAGERFEVGGFHFQIRKVTGQKIQLISVRVPICEGGKSDETPVAV
ncbi:MAG TPA: hemolysin family protein [Candidatus Ozemobacteraceae bacterium]|nr:hemolysin family protein [Candidatus Ozemobacteraceae bacterium]